MELKRLMELAGVESTTQLDELDNTEVKQHKDTIDTLRAKLKAAGINTSAMSDILILKFANVMKDITIESKEMKAKK